MTINRRFITVVVLAVAVTAGVVGGWVTAQDDETHAKIENAMSAAPYAIAKDATVMDVNAEGEVVVLREGTNEWTCWPDNPTNPGNDPACLDPVFMQWNDAIAAGAEPELTSVGLAYMLQGGTDASNTEPLLEPAEGEDWVYTPPHVMIVFPKDFDLSLFPTDHEYGGPYVMWAGTPYEHIMMPVNIEGIAHQD